MLTEDWKHSVRKCVEDHKEDTRGLLKVLQANLNQQNPRWNPSWMETAEFMLEVLEVPGETFKEKLVCFQLLNNR